MASTGVSGLISSATDWRTSSPLSSSAITDRIRMTVLLDHLSMMTSVDLMMALTLSPAWRPSVSAEVRVMAETISMVPTVTTTSAMMPPSFTDLTVPSNWFLALNMVNASASCDQVNGWCFDQGGDRIAFSQVQFVTSCSGHEGVKRETARLRLRSPLPLQIRYYERRDRRPVPPQPADRR